MAIPNTYTFDLQDVVDEVNPTTDDLEDCFDNATQSYFDENFVPTGFDTDAVDKSDYELRYFRNYGNTDSFMYDWSRCSSLGLYAFGSELEPTYSSYAQSVHVANSGSKMYITANSGYVYEYSMSTPYDLGTVSYDGHKYISYKAMAIKWYGARNFYVIRHSGFISHYQTNIAGTDDYSIVNSTYQNGKDIGGYLHGSAHDFLFNASKSRLYVFDLDSTGNEDRILQFNLSTPGDPRTITNLDGVKILDTTGYGTSFHFRGDSTMAYMLERDAIEMLAYPMDVGPGGAGTYDIDSISSSSSSLYLDFLGGGTTDLLYAHVIDDEYMYVVSHSDDSIRAITPSSNCP